jgi:hypothetical protein
MAEYDSKEAIDKLYFSEKFKRQWRIQRSNYLGTLWVCGLFNIKYIAEV